jgi:diguanylate cyclase (GGDEF)-like protein
LPVLNDRVVELGLGSEASSRRRVEALRGLIEQSIGVLRDAIAVYAEADYNDCCDGLDDCRGAVASGADPDTLEERVGPCLDASRRAVADIRLKQQERRRELTGLVTLVREAIAAVGIENDSLRTGLIRSLDRFEAVGQFGDIKEIKKRLAAEVLVMKQAMAERNQAWEARVEELGERVTLLETELLTSRREASLDPLTHLANRRTFDRTCREWTKSPRAGFVLAMIDIDGFKAINDAFGHGGGDRALVAVAQALKGSVRAQDLVARIGGDEFALLMSDLTLRQAESRLKTVVASIAAIQLPSVPDPSFVLTVSCGASECSAGDTSSSLIQRADEALYEAKRTGKNRVLTKARPYLSDLMKRR